MDTQRKKKIAAIIAAVRFLEQSEAKPLAKGFWQKMSVNRMVQAKEVLFRRGKLVGPKNL